MAESRRRLQHLRRAVRRLEERIDRLVIRVNSLRQEEIIEEIEVILLSAAALRVDLPGPGGYSSSLRVTALL